MNLNDRIRSQVSGWMSHNRAIIGDRELLDRLREHFDALDTEPKDGVIHITEIRKIRSTPPANFTDRDIAMLDLLEKYYNLLREMDDDTAGGDSGISRADLNALEVVLDQSLTDHILATLNNATEKDEN